MPWSAANPNCWTRSLRKDLRVKNGVGWWVREKAGEIQHIRADEDGRSSMMLDIQSHLNSTIHNLSAVEQLHQRMIQLGCSLRHTRTCKQWRANRDREAGQEYPKGEIFGEGGRSSRQHSQGHRFEITAQS